VGAIERVNELELERIWFIWSDDLANLETEARGRRTLEELWAASAHATSQSAVGAAEEIPLPPRSRRYTKSGCALDLQQAKGEPCCRLRWVGRHWQGGRLVAFCLPVLSFALSELHVVLGRTSCGQE
jgi:hypothetical protein